MMRVRFYLRKNKNMRALACCNCLCQIQILLQSNDCYYREISFGGSYTSIALISVKPES